MRTVSMRLVDLVNRPMLLGFRGENLHTQVRIDCKRVFSEYPNAVPSISARPPKGEAYPVITVRDGDIVIWNVTDGDLARDGEGEFQLSFVVDGIVVKSYIGRTRIDKSITPTGPAPDPVEDWLVDANAALATIEKAAGDAEEAVRNANQAVETANAAAQTANTAALKIDGMTVEASGLEAGATPTAEVTDVEGHKNIAFGIPKGDKGDPGDPGEPGDPTLLIDDTAGTGETEKTWSANKLAEGIGGKISKPSTSPDGAKGQTLITNGDGTTLWVKTLVTPQMYGALANGVHDDTEAIQTAVNEHSKVFFPEGNYKITAPILLRNGTTIEGASKYYSTIWAYGCDCFHLKTGDGGERGNIYNIHLRSDKTADAKGIKISSNAPGWTFQDVWINSFDYGIYAYKVNANNYYITRCIITGHSTPAPRTCKYGIFLQNSTSGAMNANYIRECEINNFKVGIAIGGTCQGILQNTIQTNEFGIVIDDDIPTTLGQNPFNTSALTINGNYMEGVLKAGIYFNIKTYCSSVQITNNYIYKDAQSDANYGAIHLKNANASFATRIGSVNAPRGLVFAGFFVGMNHFSVPSGSKEYVFDNALSADSVLMASQAGGIGNTTNILGNLEPNLTSAKIITAYVKSRKITTFYNEKTWWNDNVTILDEKTALLNNGGVLKMYFRTNLVSIYDIAAKMADYGENNKYVNAWICYRSGTDGRMYSRNTESGMTPGGSYDLEDKDLTRTWEGSWTLKSTDVGQDGFIHRTPMWTTTYNGGEDISHNAFSEYILLIVSHFDGITVKAPTVEYLLGTE